MKINRNSMGYKILVPIFALVTVITVCLLLLVYWISSAISEDYHRFTSTRYSNDVKGILDTAITELTSAQLLNKKPVVEAKQRAVIEALRLYWSKNNIDGAVLDTNGRVVASSLDAQGTEQLLSMHAGGHFHFSQKVKHVHGYAVEFSPWQWTVVTLLRPITPRVYRKEIAFLLPLIAGASLFMATGVFAVLRRNFQRPMGAVIRDITAGETIGTTGITELDTIGEAINDSFGKILKKTEQYQLLHDLAVSIHENLSIDEMLRLILELASRQIRAELAAITLYDEKGGFKKLLTLGTPQELEGRTPRGKGILELMKLSFTPLRIDDVMAHPAFAGPFPEGHPVVKNLLGHPIHSAEGRPIGALYFGNKPGGFTGEDEAILGAISADAAMALSKAEQVGQLKRFKEVIDSAFDVIVITDGDGRILYVNPAFENVTGYERDEVLGKTTGILKSGHHPDEFYRDLWATVTSGGMWKGEIINRKKDGSIYHASAIVFTIGTEHGVNYVSIQRDITQEKRLYEQLLRAQKMEAIGTLAGGIAHDFNNLLAGILGYSEIILTQTKEGDPFHKPATIIRQAAERGADLAKKILMITRKEKMEARAVNLNEIIRSSEELLERSMPKNIEIILKLKDDLPLIKADPTQMQQVVMNLAVNARDAMPTGGRLVIETSVVGKENGAANGLTPGKGGFLKLSISDTGMGMDVETQRKIFDPFFTTKETGKGTGLGLYIVHSVVNNHGGYINLYSEPGKGTRFNIYLPATRGLAAKEPDEPEDLRGTGTILVIDDEPPIRELCRDLLEPLGYIVLLAENGEAGVQIFREHRDSISLVILDMVMPRMGGSEVFQSLRTIRPDVTVLLCSGYSHNGFAGIDTLLQSGARGFIQKPFTRHTIAGAVKKALLRQEPETKP